MNDLLEHVPVMTTESIEALIMQKNGVYVDATFGFGGHNATLALGKYN